MLKKDLQTRMDKQTGKWGKAAGLPSLSQSKSRKNQRREIMLPGKYVRTAEIRAKLSAANSGKHHSEEARAKMSAERSGENNPLYGKHHSAETRAKISAAQIGKTRPHVGHPHTPESRAKLSAALSGENNPLYGRSPSVETRVKLSAALSGENHPLYGKHLPIETRAKLSAAHLGKPKPHTGRPHTPESRAKLSAANSGEKSPKWRGGISFEPYCLKFNKDLKRRIRAFFDNQCVLCGKSNTENKKDLCCHHVEYNKKACCDGKPVHFAALCSSCHSGTNQDRDRWEAMMHLIIDEIYSGRSYFTKEEFASLENKP